MTPLVAAVWSCAAGDAMDYPARYLFVFLEHHGMLSVFGSPTWRTVAGGSATYVEAIACGSPKSCGDACQAVERVPEACSSPETARDRGCSTPSSSPRIPTRR